MRDHIVSFPWEWFSCCSKHLVFSPPFLRVILHSIYTNCVQPFCGSLSYFIFVYLSYRIGRWQRRWHGVYNDISIQAFRIFVWIGVQFALTTNKNDQSSWPLCDGQGCKMRVCSLCQQAVLTSTWWQTVHIVSPQTVTVSGQSVHAIIGSLIKQTNTR